MFHPSSRSMRQQQTIRGSVMMRSSRPESAPSNLGGGESTYENFNGRNRNLQKLSTRQNS